MSGYSSVSGGPSVDSLGLKLSGTTALPDDLKRGDEVEIVVRGVVRGHLFEDKVNSQTGDVEHTTKYAKVAIDELESCTVLAYKRRSAPVGQTAFTDDGGTVDASTGQELVVTGEAEEEEAVDAEVVAELPPGQPPEGVDPATGEVDPEPPAPGPFRHPQIPEPAWEELNHEQREAVNALVEKHARFTEAAAIAENPTDRKAYSEKAADLVSQLVDDFGIEIIPADQVREADEDVLADGEPPPPPIDSTTGPRSMEQLQKRRAYLTSKRALGPDAEQRRADELAEIDRRMRAQGAA